MILPQAYTIPNRVFYPPMTYGMPQQVPAQPAARQPVQINPNDVKNIKDMFPDLDEEVIRSVLQARAGNVDAAVSDLLSLNEK